MKTRIAVPITATSIRQGVKDIELASKAADMIELRLDFFKKHSAKDIQSIMKVPSKPVICTCRPVREGGKFAGTEQEREEILHNAIVAGADFVDVEISSDINFRKEIF